MTQLDPKKKGPEGTEVVAVEDGRVTKIEDFTGSKADPPSPWWNDTQAVQVEGEKVVVLYGEIETNESLKVGVRVKKGDNIGRVKRVLTKEKGRPMAMLHLEVHVHGARDTPEWPVDSPKPPSLLDPTPFLLPLFNK